MQKLAVFGSDADVQQSIVDTSKAFGILSPYTSMLVVRDERFAELAIARTNRDRLAVEAAAKDTRKAQAVQSVRVDNSQPMFSAPRPTHSGGGGGSGAFGLPGLLLALVVFLGGLVGTRSGRPACRGSR